jgi:hypothetical protein
MEILFGRNRCCFRAEPGAAAGGGGAPPAPPAAAAQGAPAAPAASAAGAGQPITMTQTQLDELKAQWKRDAVMERFGEQGLTPEARKRVQELEAENARLKGATLSETQQAIAQRDEVARQLADEKVNSAKAVQAAEQRYLDQVLTTKVTEYGTLRGVPGVQGGHFARATKDLLKVNDKGDVYGVDPRTGLHVPLAQFLDAWRAEEVNKMWNPPPGSGDGTHTGRPAEAPAFDLSKATPEQLIAMGYAQEPPRLDPLVNPQQAAAQIPGRPTQQTLAGLVGSAAGLPPNNPAPAR